MSAYFLVGSLDLTVDEVPDARDDAATTESLHKWVTDNALTPATAPIVGTPAHPVPNGKVSFVIRPAKISISAEKPTDRNNVFPGKVIDIAYLGNLSTYHVALPGGQMIKAQAANTRRVSRRSFTWEDPVWVSWTATAGVLLSE